MFYAVLRTFLLISVDFSCFSWSSNVCIVVVANVTFFSFFLFSFFVMFPGLFFHCAGLPFTLTYFFCEISFIFLAFLTACYPDHCTKCYDNNHSSCQVCETGYIVDNHSCTKGSTESCSDPNCKLCSASVPWKCLECKDNFNRTSTDTCKYFGRYKAA